MTRLRNWVAALATAGLLASGCGGGSEESSVTTIGVLSAALSNTAEASTYRVAVYSGTTLRLPAIGFESVTELDEERPLLVGEISSEREHFIIDLGALLEALLDDAGDIGFELWVDDEHIVFDTSNYQQFVDADPEIDLGPLAPGVFSIDLAAIGADSPELLAALVGSSAPDLSELALSLPTALKEIEQTSTNPQIFVGTTTYADLLEAQGADVEVFARSYAGGIALTQPRSVDALTEFYVDLFKGVDAEVVVELDERGLLRVLSTRVDLSGIYSNIFDDESLFPETTELERQQGKEQFADAYFVVEFRSVYESDIDLEVPLPPAATEDRTAEWREFLINAGFEG